jgi:hypothetical protein
MNEGKANWFGALLEDKALDANHAYYKGLSAIDNSISPALKLEDGYTIAGDRIRVSPFYRHNDFAEETAITSLLWDLYDNTPLERLGGTRGTESVQLSLNDLINSLIFAKTTSEYYLSLVSVNVINKGLLDAVIANHGICIDSNNNGDCAGSEVKDGLSTWKVRYSGSTYGYPYPGYKFPGGRP